MCVTIETVNFSRMGDVLYEIHVKEGDYPIAPLVSIENLPTEGSYEVQMLVYLPSEITETPNVIADSKGTAVCVLLPSGKEIWARKFILEYDYKHDELPTNYVAWEIKMKYSVDDSDPVDLKKVDFIITHLQDLDPKTSRGTVTTVLHA